MGMFPLVLLAGANAESGGVGQGLSGARFALPGVGTALVTTPQGKTQLGRTSAFVEGKDTNPAIFHVARLLS